MSVPGVEDRKGGFNCLLYLPPGEWDHGLLVSHGWDVPPGDWRLRGGKCGELEHVLHGGGNMEIQRFRLSDEHRLFGVVC